MVLRHIQRDHRDQRERDWSLPKSVKRPRDYPRSSTATTTTTHWLASWIDTPVNTRSLLGAKAYTHRHDDTTCFHARHVKQAKVDTGYWYMQEAFRINTSRYVDTIKPSGVRKTVIKRFYVTVPGLPSDCVGGLFWIYIYTDIYIFLTICLQKCEKSDMYIYNT